MPDSFKRKFCQNRGEKFEKQILAKRGMLQELNEYENGKIKRRNPKVIVDNEREKRYLEVILTVFDFFVGALGIRSLNSYNALKK